MHVSKAQYESYLSSSGRWTRVANALLQASTVSLGAKGIFAYLCSLRPSQETSRNKLAKALDVDPATATKYLKELEQIRAIRLIKGKRSSWNFEILPPDKWLISASSLGSEREKHSVATDGSLQSEVTEETSQPLYMKKEENSLRHASSRDEEMKEFTTFMASDDPARDRINTIEKFKEYKQSLKNGNDHVVL